MMLQHWNLLFASQKDVHVYENDPLCEDLLLLRCCVAAPQHSPAARIFKSIPSLPRSSCGAARLELSMTLREVSITPLQGPSP